jgi:hypothetical protein
MTPNRLSSVRVVLSDSILRNVRLTHSANRRDLRKPRSVDGAFVQLSQKQTRKHNSAAYPVSATSIHSSTNHLYHVVASGLMLSDHCQMNQLRSIIMELCNISSPTGVYKIYVCIGINDVR